MMLTRIEYSPLHPWTDGLPPVRVAQTTAPDVDVTPIARRIIATYQESRQFARTQSAGPLWEQVQASHHRDFIGLILREDVGGLSAYLSQIYRRGILHGIDLTDDEAAAIEGGEPRLVAVHAMDRLAALAEALGVRPVENPEQGHWAENLYGDPDALLDDVETALGFGIVPPTVAGGRYGLATSKGVVCLKDLYSLYAAWRIKQLTAHAARPCVCEIGGGTGMVAYYARLLGIHDYTIVDLPQIGAAQLFVLERTMPGRVGGFGEPEHDVKLQPTWALEPLERKFDLFFNQDSMPEMGAAIAADYLTHISRLTPLFLSINHEAETDLMATDEGVQRQPRVTLLARRDGRFRPRYRFHYWLRRGYVEEVFDVAP